MLALPFDSRRVTPVWLLAAGLLVPGCQTPVPQAVDPLAGVRASEDSPYRRLTAAVLYSDNTKNAMSYAREVNAKSRGAAQINSDRIFLGFDAVIQRNFRAAVKIGGGDDAAALGADLIALYDIQAELPNGIAEQKFDAKIILMTPGKDVIDTVSGRGASTTHLSMWGEGWGQAASLSAEQAQQELEKNLLSSPKLLEYARTHPGGPRRVEEPAIAAAPEPVRIHSDVDRPRHRLAERPDDYAVVVGIEKYSNDLPDAQFAERDAEAVKEHLLALGYPQRNIKYLIGSRAVKSSLEAYLEDWLPRNVKPNSRVFFYFSGHGAPTPESGQAYLVPWDGNPNFLDKTAFPIKKLYGDLNALNARQVVVALDSCFSGAGGRSLLPEGSRPLVNSVDLSLTNRGKLLLFTAASPKEITSTLKEQGHGIFTYYFLKGLDGAAEDDTGAVTARGLYNYLKPKVQDAASRQNRDQTPGLDGMVTAELAKFSETP